MHRTLLKYTGFILYISIVIIFFLSYIFINKRFGFSAFLLTAVVLVFMISMFFVKNSIKCMNETIAEFDNSCDPYVFYDKVTEYYKKRSSNMMSEDNLLINLAAACISMGEFEKGEEFLRKIKTDKFTFKNSSSVKAVMGTIYCNLASCAMQNPDRLDEAEGMIDSLKGVAENIGNDMFRSQLMKTYDYQRAALLAKRGKFQEASDIIEKVELTSLAVGMENKMSNRLAISYEYALAVVCEGTNRFDEAIKHAEYVIEHGGRMHDVTLSKAIIERLKG